MKAHKDVREGESDMGVLGSSVPTEPSSGYPSRAAPNRSQDPSYSDTPGASHSDNAASAPPIAVAASTSLG